MTTSCEELFDRINAIVRRLSDAAAYVQNDLQRLLDDGHTTPTAISEACDAQQQIFQEVRARVDEISSECLAYHKQFAPVGFIGFLVKLTYFKTSGKFYTSETCFVEQESLIDIWEDICIRRDYGNLPGLSPGAGPEFDILIEVPGHPHAPPKMLPSEVRS